MPSFAYDFAGFGVVNATSVTSSGPITGTVVKGTTALEYPLNASAPGVRCTQEPDTGFGCDAANEVAIFGGGVASVLVTASQMLTVATTEAVFLGEHETRNKKVRTKRTQDIAAAGATIDPGLGLQEVVEVTLSAGNITITSTPFIANGDDGQELTIVNVDATDTLTIPDEATTPGSNTELRAATRALAPAGGYLKLRFSTALAAWHEVGFG